MEKQDKKDRVHRFPISDGPRPISKGLAYILSLYIYIIISLSSLLLGFLHSSRQQLHVSILSPSIAAESHGTSLNSLRFYLHYLIRDRINV